MYNDHLMNYSIDGRIAFSESDRDWKVTVTVSGEAVREAAAKTPMEAITALNDFLKREMALFAQAEGMVSGWEAKAFGLDDIEKPED